VALHLHSSENEIILPAPSAWIGAAEGHGCKPVLKCPKGYYTGGTSGIASTEDNVQQIPRPISAVFNDLESNTRVHAFVERQNYVLPTNVTVDISEPGRYSNDYARTSKTVPAGTIVSCFFLHYDPIGNTNSTTSGAITFSNEVIGLIVVTSNLDKTDSVLGAPGTLYANGQRSRGFENNAEIITLEDDMRTLTIHRFQSTFPGEEVRILVIPKGEASYGMNDQVRQRAPRMQQLLLVEYGQPVADHDGRMPDDDPNLLAPRHLGKANVLFVDGSVRSMWPDEILEDRELWEP
jgi:prepilin-type processing-associated H-X9-DG protein